MKTKESLKKLAEDLKPMSWPKRLDHIWTYYKEVMLLVVLGVVVVVGFISSFIDANKVNLINGMMVNITMEQEGYNYLTQDFAKLVEAQEDEEVTMEYTEFLSMADPTSGEDNYYAAMILIAEVSAQKLEYVIHDKLSLEFYLTQDVFMDLQEFFTPEELAQWEDKLVYGYEEDTGRKWVAAVDITDTPFVRDNVTSQGPIYFSLGGSTEKTDMCRRMWENILAWEEKE